jgi:hypothetical protein
MTSSWGLGKGLLMRSLGTGRQNHERITIISLHFTDEKTEVKKVSELRTCWINQERQRINAGSFAMSFISVFLCLCVSKNLWAYSPKNGHVFLNRGM